MIPDEAVEAAKAAIWDLTGMPVPFEWQRDMLARAALEAAAPHMLSHERQQTADAHRDAIVNRDTAGQLQAESDLMRWKLAELKGWADAMINESNSPQYGRDVRALLEVASMDEAREIDAL